MVWSIEGNSVCHVDYIMLTAEIDIGNMTSL